LPHCSTGDAAPSETSHNRFAAAAQFAGLSLRQQNGTPRGRFSRVLADSSNIRDKYGVCEID